MDIKPRNDVATRIVVIILLSYLIGFLLAFSSGWFSFTTLILLILALAILIGETAGTFVTYGLPFRRKDGH